VTGLLLERGLPVRAMVRREDDRVAALRAAGAEVVVGDLLEPADVYRVVSGCRRVYFGLEAFRAHPDVSFKPLRFRLHFDNGQKGSQELQR
jgi:uncharacterized protein YbjT (DUF2867 family)